MKLFHFIQALLRFHHCLFVLFYIGIAAGAVTHKDLLLENPVKLPFLNVELPLVAFFVLAPILFIVSHAYMLVHFVMLGAKVGVFDTELRAQLGDAPETRESLRRQLPSNIFVQFLAGLGDIRKGGLGLILKAIAWFSLVIGPVLLGALPGLNEDRIAATSAAHTLKPEQADALRHLTGAHGFSMLLGEAGTGKSHTLNAARAAYESEGFNVVGLSWTNKVTQAMRDDGFANVSTIASALKKIENGRGGWDRKSVLIVDEAAQISTGNLSKLAAAARESGSKLILCGDDAQLGSIERGGMFETLLLLQAQFLPYHLEPVTWVQRVAVFADDPFVAALPAVLNGRSKLMWRLERRGKGWLGVLGLTGRYIAGLIACLIPIGLAFTAATFPGEWLDEHVGNDLLFNGEVDDGTRRRKSIFSKGLA